MRNRERPLHDQIEAKRVRAFERTEPSIAVVCHRLPNFSLRREQVQRSRIQKVTILRQSRSAIHANRLSLCGEELDSVEVDRNSSHSRLDYNAISKIVLKILEVLSSDKRDRRIRPADLERLVSHQID